MPNALKMSISTAAMVAALTLVGVAGARASMMDVEMAKIVQADANLNDCATHEQNRVDCHVHDEATYLHVRQHAPEQDHAHAWAEFRNWQTHFKTYHR